MYRRKQNEKELSCKGSHLVKLNILKHVMLIRQATVIQSGFGGLVVSMLVPLVPKIAGLNPAKAIGFFRA
jgi:hypothetical protein